MSEWSSVHSPEIPVPSCHTTCLRGDYCREPGGERAATTPRAATRAADTCSSGYILGYTYGYVLSPEPIST